MTTQTEMTIADVKRDLPDVPVTIGRKRFMARLSGRLCPFGTLTVSYITHGAPRHYLRGRPWIDAQFSWDAIARAVNTGKPLAMDS